MKMTQGATSGSQEDLVKSCLNGVKQTAIKCLLYCQLTMSYSL